MKTFGQVIAAIGMLVLAFSARADVELKGGGATFPEPIYRRWIAEYQKVHPEVKIDYAANGSGAGISGITAKTFNFAGSDAPMSKKELTAAGGREGLVEIPSIIGAVVLAYNLPGLQGELKLDGPTVGEIYLGKVKTWNDPAIAGLNPGLNLPNLPITTVHRTDGSGTTYIFTNYVSTQNVEFDKRIGSGKSVEWPAGSGGPKNAGVMQVVQQTPGSIGYVELAYAVQNKIPFALLKNKDGKFVKASSESASLAGEGAVANLKGDILDVGIWNQPGENAYPISSFTYLIVYKDLGYVKDPNKARVLADFLRWVTSDGQKFAGELDYAPLSDGVQKKVHEALSHLTWDGKAVASR